MNLYVCLFLVALKYADAVLSKEERAMLRSHSESCMTEWPIDPVDREALLNSEFRDSPAMRKHMYCVLLKCKIVGKDGKLMKSALMGKMPRAGKNASKLLEACSEQSGTTPEDLAWNLFRCSYDKKTPIFELMPSSAAIGETDNNN